MLLKSIKNKLMIIFILSLFAFYPAFHSECRAQSLAKLGGSPKAGLHHESFVSPDLIKSRSDDRLYEIGDIRFAGNITYSSSDLGNAITSRPTERSWQHSIFDYLNREIKKNNAAPNLLKKVLNRTVESYKAEIRFFDNERARSDSLSIWHFYNKNGFHDVEVYYTFAPDSDSRKNILTYHIIENRRYSLGKLQYLGLDSLPNEITSAIDNLRLISVPAQFNEDKIVNEIKLIARFLLDNGYFYARFLDPPLVFSDTASFSDSVVVEFIPGQRQRISDILMVDSTRGQFGVAHGTKVQQLAFSRGDWYSRSNVTRSEDNLRSLGVFDLVSIDTNSHAGIKTDTSLPLMVFTQYRKLQEWSLGWFVNQTTYDKFINTGIEGSYINRNLFGGAQVFSPYMRFVIKNVTDYLENPLKNKIEPEGQIGFQFGQSLFFTIDNSRVGLFSNPLYSYRFVNGEIPISTFSFPLKLPVSFPGNTYFNNMSVDLAFEWQVPIDFDNSLEKALSKARTPEEQRLINESAITLSQLNDFNLRSHWLRPTANIIGVSIFADHRDNIFSPTKGDYAAISLEFGTPLGFAQYLRFQFAYYYFHPFNRYTVLALKGRIGSIYSYSGGRGYVPFERQFFSGGANSVRGWGARKLRYSQLLPDSVGGAENYEFFESFFGNAGLVEASIEVRYRFQRPGTFGNFWDEQIANLGISIFLDFGNGFHWFADPFTVTKFEDFLTKIAVATGLGIRYETPVGPVRVDFGWPFFDPNSAKDKWLFQRQNGLGKFVFHVAIGNAF